MSDPLPAKKKFPKSKLTEEHELPYECHGGQIIHKRITGKSRWSINYEIVFRFDDMPKDRAWLAKYSVGATESQDEGPWEYEDYVECTLVHPVEKTVTVWDPVPTPAG